MDIYNSTPFKVGVRHHMDSSGADLIVLGIKATFNLPDNGRDAGIAEDQVEICCGDVPFDTNENSGIRYPSDLVPGKVNTDIGFSGSVWSYGGKPVKTVTALLRVGACGKKIKVFGDRIWKKRFLIPGYYRTSPGYFVSIPMTSDRMFGGRDSGHKNKKKHRSWPENRHGTGYFRYGKGVAGSRLPNFEDPRRPITSWRSKPPVASFGFAPESAKHRRKYAGTYDKKWKETRFPLPPDDFDNRFYNCAQKELIAKGFLKGGEPVLLKHLSRVGERSFLLPRIGFKTRFCLENEIIEKSPDLYHVVFEPDDNRFYMTFGAVSEVGINPSQVSEIEIFADAATKQTFNLTGHSSGGE